ncbi:hypothetical protein SHIRM173S_13358 [Streptomyces hirsutus]
MANDSAWSTTNSALRPSARFTSKRSPFSSSERRANTAAEIFVSTCPAMIDAPRSPGDAPSANQPTRLVSSGGGASSSPEAATARSVKGASTSMSGIRNRVGADRGRCLPAGRALAEPLAVGLATGLEAKAVAVAVADVA